MTKDKKRPSFFYNELVAKEIKKRIHNVKKCLSYKEVAEDVEKWSRM